MKLNIFKPYLFHRFLAFILAIFGGLLIYSAAYAAPTTSSNFDSVHKGDTLSHIALDNGISIKDLAYYNLLSEPDHIGLDQPLYTPVSSLHSESENPFHLINIREQKDAVDIGYPETLFSQIGSERGNVTIEHRLYNALTEEFKLGGMVIHKLGESEAFSSLRFEDCPNLDVQQDELAFTNFSNVLGPCKKCEAGLLPCKYCKWIWKCRCNTYNVDDNTDVSS